MAASERAGAAAVGVGRAGFVLTSDPYADNVELYTRTSREKAVAIKNAAFAKHDHDTLGPITVMGTTATFDKTSKAKDGKVIQVSAYIDVDASKKIIAECDAMTDANLERRKSNQCSAAIIALVQSTPEGKADTAKQVWTEPPPHGGGAWKVNYTQMIGGQKIDENTVEGLRAWSDVFEVDAKVGTVVFVGTSIAGPTEYEYQMHASGKALTCDAITAAKVRAVCN